MNTKRFKLRFSNRLLLAFASSLLLSELLPLSSKKLLIATADWARPS